jgi:hypothetical protein
MDGTFGHSIGMHGKFYQEIKEGEEWAIYIKKENINMHASNANIVAHFSCCVMCKDDSRAYCLSLLHKQSVVLHIFMICS